MADILTITINDADKTGSTLLQGFRLKTRINDATTLSISFKGEHLVPANEASWESIEITDNRTSTKLFTGLIVDSELQFYTPSQHIITCNCANQVGTLIPWSTRTLDFSAGDHNEKQILTDLFAGWTPNPITTHIINGNATSIVFTNSSIKRILDDLAAANSDRLWYFDATDELHWFASTGETAPFGLSDTPNNTTTFDYGKLKFKTSSDYIYKIIGGSLVCWKEGLCAGMALPITNSHLSWTAEIFIINEVEMRYLGGDLQSTATFEYTVYFGDVKNPRITDLIARANQNVSTVDRGLIPPLTNASGQYLNASGAWTTPSAGYTDAQAKAAAVQSGAITDGVTKAPTHDAVFDVKTTADGAMAKSLLTERGSIIYRNATIPAELLHGTDGQVLTTKGNNADPIWTTAGGMTDPLTEQGSLIFRNATIPAELLHGTSGQFLKTLGHGADPIWVTIAGGMTDPLTERGSIIFRNATVPAELLHGTDLQVLTTKGHGVDPTWSFYPTSSLTGGNFGMGIYPSATNTYALGTTDAAWSHIFGQSIHGLTFTVGSGGVYPIANGSYNLGTTSYHWNKLWTNYIDAGASILALSGTYITCAATLYPTITNTFSLGTTDAAWEHIWGKYIHGLTISVGSGGIYPIVSSSYDLGTITYPWNKLWTNYIGSSQTLALSGTYISCGASIYPTVNNLFQCGFSNYAWSHIYGIRLYAEDGTVHDFQEYDDIQLLKNLKAKPNKEGRMSLDASSLPDELVKISDDGKTKFVNMGGLQGLTIGILRKLNAKIEKLEGEIEKLKK